MAVLSPHERLVAALRAHGSLPKGKNWQCPGHDDKNPSLSVSPSVHLETGEPTVLLHYHAGCSIDEILSGLGLEPSDLFTGNGHRQEQLFPLARYSPVGLDIWLKIPPSAQRDFAIASILGRYLPISGGREHVYSQRQIVAVVLESKHRRALRDTLDKSYGHISNLMTDWESWGTAHRCSRLVWTLFVRVSDLCPSCRKSTPTGEDEDQESKPTGEDGDYESKPVGEVSRHEALITDDGFFKGVSDDGGETRWEVYPELRALEMLKERRRR